jgi:large conductance mechanosensitive channel
LYGIQNENQRFFTQGKNLPQYLSFSKVEILVPYVYTMLKDFQKFLIKGNAVDMAVGFIFGAAFATVIKSLVNNIVMPPIGFLLGKVDFSNLKYILVMGNETTEEVAISYGIFINEVISFIILGFIIFIIVRMIGKLQKKEEKKTPPTPKQEILLEEIRDLLKKK